ncbi:DUF4294 domain-containing protein [Parvicella tangerina]|uniref:DUF4294 domain-containing protein n=1 Tax=Parvicella tangerina TaxID=2829795 RepID=A0A916JLV2_9FLAO|nr:DUF4294 domain-containing protein [Parvicella tangerina]CAG5081661.1 hypothetical protein CRYO30217_01696 [Parvicella tangerina]
MRLLGTFILLISIVSTWSQYQRPIPVVGQDSIPSYILDEADIVAFDAEFQKEYDRAKFYAVRVYEYAQIAAAMVNEFEDTLETMDRKWDQNKFLKQAKKDLKDEFGDEIANFSVNRGMYLMKIIHKETGLSAYEIIKKYNGGINALMWQSTMKFFGASLKHDYEPTGEDEALSVVLREIESGELKPYSRPAKTTKAKESLSKKEKKKMKKKKKKAEKEKEKAKKMASQ